MTKHETFSAQTPPFKARYGNFINGAFEAPKAGRYFDNISPITGQKICEIARSDEDDIEAALDAAHAAKDAWGTRQPRRARQDPQRASPTGWRPISRLLAAAETWDNGKPIRETTARRRAAGHRPLPLFRRLRARAGRLDLARSTTTPSPITSTSRSASSARSFRGTSRC